MITADMQEGLTFDDVLLVPARSDVLPAETDTSTQFTRGIPPAHPALLGGDGHRHREPRSPSPSRSRAASASSTRTSPSSGRPKRSTRSSASESGMIVDPVTIRPDRPVREALAVMERYKISGVPVVDEDGHLVGIITNRDLRFETRFDIPVSEVMTPQPLVTVPVGTTLDEAKGVLQKHRIEKLLVVDGDKHLKGLITVKDIQKAISYPIAAKDDLGRLRVAAAIGATGDFTERAAELVARASTVSSSTRRTATLRASSRPCARSSADTPRRRSSPATSPRPRARAS